MLVHINSKRYVDMMHFKGLWSFFRREHTSNPANDKSLNVCTSPTDIHHRASSTCRLLIFPQASVCIRSNTTTLNHWFGAILFCLKSSSGPFLQLTIVFTEIFANFHVFCSQVPLVPLVPILNMFVNIYLMVSLPPSTWYKLLVWLAAGECSGRWRSL